MIQTPDNPFIKLNEALSMSEKDLFKEYQRRKKELNKNTSAPDNELRCPKCRKLLAKLENGTYIYKNSAVTIPITTYMICNGITYNGKMGKETTCNTEVWITNNN